MLVLMPLSTSRMVDIDTSAIVGDGLAQLKVQVIVVATMATRIWPTAGVALDSG